MFLLSKILLKFTPKFNKLHLTTITLLKANFNKIYSKLHHLFFSQTPYSNGFATIALFLCNKWRFLEFSEGKIVSKYTSNRAIYQLFRELACLQTHLAGTWLQFIIIFVIFKAKS